jgi:hypothetical protein
MNRSDSPKMSLSVDKFCELYNDVPKVFVAYATMVNLSAETYRKTTAQIIFEEENNSNYWIIPVANTANDAWLVPNPSRKVNYATLKSLPFAFESNNQEHLKQLSSFILSQPAQVMSLPTEPTTWKLIKHGVIVFGNVEQQNKELQDIISSIEIEEIVKGVVSNQLMELEKSVSILYSEVKSQRIKITNLLNQQNSVNQSVSAHIQSLEKKSENHEREIQELVRGNQNSVNQSVNKHIQSIEKKSENHERKIQELMRGNQKQDREIQILQSILPSQNVQQTNSTKDSSTKNTSDLTFTAEELDWLQDYNSNFLDVPSSLRDRVNVSINEEIFTRLRRDGDESNIAFEPDRKGNYWVIARGRYHYIVPSKQRRMTTQAYAITKAIYKCDGYSESYKNFSLVKSALVSEESIGCWKLVRKGILEFT